MEPQVKSKTTPFNVGDVVRLTAGGPHMTVSIVEPDTQQVTCTWYESDESDFKSREFGSQLLKQVD